MRSGYDESIRLFFEELDLQAGRKKEPGKRLAELHEKPIDSVKSRQLYKSFSKIATLFGVNISFYKGKKQTIINDETVDVEGEVVIYKKSKDKRTVKIVLKKKDPFALLHELVHVADFILSGAEDEEDSVKDEIIAHLAEYVIMSEIGGRYSPEDVIRNVIMYATDKEPYLEHVDYVKTMTNFFLYMYSIANKKGH